MTRKMVIGIMPMEEYAKYTIEVAKGNIKPDADAPKIWFDSIESLSQVLSTKNRELLKTIKEQNPNSLSELAVSSGRHLGNLSRTLKSMERYGIVELRKESGTVKPRVRVDQFQAVFGF